VKIERGVHGLHRFRGELLIDQHADLDLARGDHLNVDAGIGQGGEHAVRHARVCLHARPDDRNLGQIAGVNDLTGTLAERGPGGDFQGTRQIVVIDGKANVSKAFSRYVLDDHVDDDVGFGQLAK